ncbi:MAG: hypothetical protein ACYCZR_02230 [Burkholderiales bacterium]
MAGDWIKMRIDLQSHPKIVRILSATESDKFRVIGGLHAVWSVFDTHSVNGELRGYTPKLMDHVIGWPGFCEAMVSVGWLSFDGDETLTMPEFDEHNGKSGKRRAEDQKRKRDARKPSEYCPEDSGQIADKKRTREEKRREELNTPITPKGVSAVGINSFLDSCKQTGELPVPEDDPVFAYAESVGIPVEFLRLAWREFVDRNRDSGKRYKDWRKAYRNCIRANWYKIWFISPDGSVSLTTQGMAAQKMHREAA